MGMYTEIYMRAELKPGAPAEVVDVLNAMLGDGDEPASLPDHPLFACDRWQNIGQGGSAYFPAPPLSGWQSDKYATEIGLHANLKNYDGEIAKFFDWIDPYLYESEGDFIGYSLYENDQTPTLFHKGGRK